MTIKHRYISLPVAVLGAAMTLMPLSSCDKGFDEMNVNPNAASADKVDAAYLLSAVMFRTGMDVSIHQRIQNLFLDVFSQYVANEGFDSQQYLPVVGWNNDYWSANYHAGWVKNLNEVIRYENEVRKGKSNVLQIARIMKCLVSSWFTDIYGDVPYSQLADGSGKPAVYDKQEDIYKDLLKELKEASAALDPDAYTMSDRQDIIFKGVIEKWKRFANSLRLRLAMHLTERDPELAKLHAEEAVAAGILRDTGDEFKAPRSNQWTAQYTNMENGYFYYGHEWDGAAMSRSMEYLLTGLGGQPFPVVKDETGQVVTPVYDDAGILLGNPENKAENPLDPKANRIRVGVPSKVDPRGPVFFAVTNKGTKASDEVMIEDKKYNMLYRWVGVPAGLSPTNKSKIQYNVKDYARMGDKYTDGMRAYDRLSYQEVCFLRAEGALRGWNMGKDAKSLYEEGITISMKKNNVPDEVITQYLQSTSPNAYGTTVKFGHNSGAGFNGKPVDTDLDKIITQKYIGLFPDGSLEAWNDHRRLHKPVLLPFAAPDPSTIKAKDGSPGNYIKRMTYPPGEKVSNEANYMDAVNRMGGTDAVSTNVWWDKE